MTEPTLNIIKATGVDIDWETHLAGAEALKKHGTTIPNELMDSFNKNKVALKGPVTTPVGEGFASVNVELRQTFNLYANLRPIKNLPGVKARYQNVDLIVVRENTEGLYSGIEHEVVCAVGEDRGRTGVEDRERRGGEGIGRDDDLRAGDVERAEDDLQGSGPSVDAHRVRAPDVVREPPLEDLAVRPHAEEGAGPQQGAEFSQDAVDVLLGDVVSLRGDPPRRRLPRADLRGH